MHKESAGYGEWKSAQAAGSEGDRRGRELGVKAADSLARVGSINHDPCYHILPQMSNANLVNALCYWKD